MYAKKQKFIKNHIHTYLADHLEISEAVGRASASIKSIVRWFIEKTSFLWFLSQNSIQQKALSF